MGTTFLTMLSGGMLGVTAFCRPEQIAWRFFRVVAIVATLLLGLVLGFLVQDEVRGPHDGVGLHALATATVGIAVALGLAFAILTSTEPLYRARFVRPVTAAGAIASLAAAGLLGHATNVWPAGATAAGLLALVGMLLSAWVVGAVTLATMLGHAYLTATKMTVAPLRRLAGLFAAGIVLRSLWVVVVGGAFAWAPLNAPEPAAEPLRRELLMIVIRCVVGLLPPCVFAYMIWETVKLRATQSATGILYFTMVLAYIGELTGMYLVRATGIPF